MTLLKQHWWKWLGTLLLLYVIGLGLLTPLKPGILDSSPDHARAGEPLAIVLTTYNTHLAEGQALRAWIKLDSQYAIAHQRIEVLGPTQLRLHFAIPPRLPVGKLRDSYTLVVDSPEDGYFLIPSAISLVQDSLDVAAAQAAWPAGSAIGGIHRHEGFAFPYRNILYETIRNLFFHVPMWFGMVLLFIGSVWHSGRYLRHFRPEDDRRALALTQVGTLFGLLGIATGALWANYTWGKFWSFDIKQTTAAIACLIYLAYFILRAAFESEEKRARIAAVYNIYAFVAMVPLIFVIPRLTDSLHPGSGGNPGLGGEDLDHTMRLVFYPAVIGWTLLGYWVASLSWRYLALRQRFLDSLD